MMKSFNPKAIDAIWMGTVWWAHLGLNQGPLACQASALPLSYAPVIQIHQSVIKSIRIQLGMKMAFLRIGMLVLNIKYL